jgi:hypothetical protein
VEIRVKRDNDSICGSGEFKYFLVHGTRHANVADVHDIMAALLK